MRHYKLSVKSQDNSKTYDLDLYDNVNIPVVFNVKDVREPESIKTNYTKQFDIPASHNNNQFFDGINENGFFTNDFNPNFKVDCQLMYDDNIIIDGFLQLIDISRTDEDGYYSVVIYGELSSLFNNLVGCKISDIDLSEYNHLWTYDNVVKSWDTSIKRNDLDIPFLKGRGYVYPLINRGQQEFDLSVEDFLPAVYVKTIWDKIFSNGEKQYKSEFLNSDKFKSLIFPYNKSKLYLSDEEKNKRIFSVEIGDSDYNDLGYAGYKKFYTGSVTNTWTSPKYKIKFPTENADPNNLFFYGDTYIPIVKQNTSIAANICIKTIFRATPGQPDGFFITGPRIRGNVYLKDATTNTFIHSEPFEVIHSTGQVGVAKTDYVVVTNVFLDYTGILEPFHQYQIYIDFISSAGPNASKFINTIGQTIGGYIFNGVSSDIDCKTELYNTTAQEWIYEGDTVDMNQLLPNDYNCIDFIKDINKMFNLYWVPIDEDTFQIEPRDVFYSSDDVNIYDWTDEADRAKEIKITPLAELNNKEYLFTYTEDDDWYNDLYTTNYTDIYGQKLIEINNDFVTNQDKIDVKFSPSPMVKFLNSDMIAPAFLTIENGFTEERDVKPRILIYGGVKTHGVQWSLKGNTFNNYPYCGHFDDPYSPTYDINWGETKEYYYDWELIPQDNLYEGYWKNLMIDISSSDSHIWTGELHIKPLDIINLNIFDTIQMDDVYYKINKLEYDILTETAKVELFKTYTYLNFPSQKITSTGNSGVVTKKPTEEIKKKPIGKPGWNIPYLEPGGGGISTGGITTNTTFGTWTNQTSKGWYKWKYNTENENLDTKKKTGNNTYSKNNLYTNINQNTFQKGSWVEIMGKKNYVAPTASQISIKGNNNNISPSVKKLEIIGDNNFIEAGVENTQVIGNGQYVTKSNAIYMNGNVIEKETLPQKPDKIGGLVNKTSSPFNSGNKVDLVKCPIDSVMNTGGVSPFNIIVGGVDNSLEFLF